MATTPRPLPPCPVRPPQSDPPAKPHTKSPVEPESPGNVPDRLGKAINERAKLTARVRNHSFEAIPTENITGIIKEYADEVKDAADGLSERIQRFEAWLNTLPGRVETYCWRQHPDADPYDTCDRGWRWGLRLHRSGKSWVISFGSDHQTDHDSPMDWKPLSEAPLRFKLFGLEMFPDLLEAIAKSQDELGESIRKACRDFDGFAAKLGIPVKEGK